MKNKVLAFDFGASSGRAILATYENGKLTLEEMHRFSNDPVMVHGTFYWDVLRLFHEIKQGILKCVNSGNGDITSIGIDTWGVDFGLLDKDGKLLENPVHYRDERTKGIMQKVFEVIPQDELYDKTGIQFLDINTLYHLYSLKLNRPDVLERAETLLFMPDLFAYLLTGEKNVEYTIASTSQLLNAKERNWDFDMIDRLGLKRSLFGKITPPGNVIGKLSKDIADELGIAQVDVIAVGSHDTASAVVSAPIEKGEKGCYVSCGTWSLLGAETKEPLINEKTFEENFTNEGGVENTIRFLKNISGLWILQETRRQWIREGDNISFKDIDKMLLTEKSANVYIDPDYAPFGKPGNMPAKINEFLKKTGQALPQSKGQYALCILESLAMTYRYYIESLEKLLGEKTEVVHLIGGGVKDVNLCRFTANITGKKITAGPVEATAIGNIAVQLIAQGTIKDVAQARHEFCSDDLKIYEPEDSAAWDAKYQDYLKYKWALQD